MESPFHELDLRSSLNTLQKQFNHLTQRVEDVERRIEPQPAAPPQENAIESESVNAPPAPAVPTTPAPIMAPTTVASPVVTPPIAVIAPEVPTAAIPVAQPPLAATPIATKPAIPMTSKPEMPPHISLPGWPANWIPDPNAAKTQASAQSTPQADSPPAAEPPVPSAPQKAPYSLIEWENLIGGKWALWLGSLCLFLSMATLLVYKWSALPAGFKVAIGLGSGLALLVMGSTSRPRSQRYFSEGLSGAGLSLCYLTLWAATQKFVVLSPALSFAGML